MDVADINSDTVWNVIYAGFCDFSFSISERENSTSNFAPHFAIFIYNLCDNVPWRGSERRLTL